jgi:hypothetical protein
VAALNVSQEKYACWTRPKRVSTGLQHCFRRRRLLLTETWARRTPYLVPRGLGRWCGDALICGSVSLKSRDPLDTSLPDQFIEDPFHLVLGTYAMVLAGDVRRDRWRRPAPLRPHSSVLKIRPADNRSVFTRRTSLPSPATSTSAYATPGSTAPASSSPVATTLRRATSTLGPASISCPALTSSDTCRPSRSNETTRSALLPHVESCARRGALR